MLLNVNSWYNRFYMYMWNEGDYELTTDGCLYLKKLFWAFITLPFTWFGALCFIKGNEPLKDKFVATFFYYLFCMVGLGLHEKNSIYIIENPYLLTIYTALSPFLMLACIIIVVYTFIAIWEWVLSPIGQGIKSLFNRSKREHKPTLAAVYIKSIKDKTCPQIIWRKNKEPEDL